MADDGAGGSSCGASSSPSGKAWTAGVHEQEACKASQLTFTLTGEDHTLGNTIRSILVRKPGVEFAGYSVPHPTQPEMNIRLQTTGESAMQLLRESFDDLASICDHLDTLYDEALEDFMKKQGESSEMTS
ncbi:DNA-directed RNA polymerase I RPAC2 [Toxoplasma gondii TgCatPRC2]|uniref:DNA-directed RNA polymerase I RPAC2 n=15 Tax=Toxoplasma gondii TaxID=5811 RepID=B9PKF9_TOXGV|nr:DNA-directed RNA polymerase I RPAC2 [Toxoplasma gondii ME49]EPR62677.1 DNA-directed RNA polymerase I RPAC2 [Toxoplasma gondii GT1]ESS32128.1 DNA-directed RNA polymerase I RPAC2 [Toxoplasma gondii VEG]KAF4641107.1 DNA-directed RNA polymerase I RPAC2 [Toxoplasma gondii]KFG39576.1 DNA-directed RNA polymerase I RPAC2 [Toxoplasma gondii p89]KFG49416.1 DNA-directed RNA polymerase I RPAC2 [Toxoplasma gondii GAB2-2007-GAL-DOM2]KFG52749.1 DNA-directed RNA polymerase I RPAC2 [Toxoplasma gondii FOU]|eukprot:XP_002365287.1 DNA-directed RNA polymerase I RPAC2 [Toxoplasma gondii ME49]